MVCPFGDTHMIVIVNISTFKGVGHYIGRSTALGNFYTIEVGRTNAIEAYRRWLENELKTNRFGKAYRYFYFLKNEYYVNNGELTLVCHCTPLPCHGEVIAQFIKEGNL